MENRALWNCVTILFMTALLALSYYFEWMTGVAIASIVIGFMLNVVAEDLFSDRLIKDREEEEEQNMNLYE